MSHIPCAVKQKCSLAKVDVAVLRKYQKKDGGL